jgi:hypothetical protein
MKEISPDTRPRERSRLPLEQKIMLLVHRYRAAEKGRKRKEAARSKCLRMTPLFALTNATAAELARFQGHTLPLAFVAPVGHRGRPGAGEKIGWLDAPGGGFL